MDPDEEECYDAGEELDDLGEEDDWCTAAGSSCCGFDRDSECGEGLDQCDLEISVPRRQCLEISVPRRQSVGIVFDRHGRCGAPAVCCDYASCRDLQVQVPRRGSARLVFDDICVRRPEVKDVEVKGEQGDSDSLSVSSSAGESADGESSGASESLPGAEFRSEADDVNSSAIEGLDVERYEDAAGDVDEQTQQDFTYEASTSEVQGEAREENIEEPQHLTGEPSADEQEKSNEGQTHGENPLPVIPVTGDGTVDASAAKTSLSKEGKVLRFANTPDDTPEEDHKQDADYEEKAASEPATAETKSLRFADAEEDTDSEKQTKQDKGKKALRFEDQDSDSPSKKPAGKKTLKFPDILAEVEKVGAKRALRFAEPEAPSKHAKTSEDIKSSKSVKFIDDVPGQSRKYSLPVLVRKTVRFLLPTFDDSGKQTSRVFFPGVRRQRRRRDTIKTATVEVYPDPPLWLVLYLMDYERFSHLTGRRRSVAWMILAWLTGAASAVAFVVCMVLLVMYLHLSPRIPLLNIKSVDYLDLWIDKLREEDLIQQQIEDKGNYFAYDFTVYSRFTVTYENGNSKLDIDNDYVEATLYYKGTSWGKAVVRGFLVRRRSQTMLKFVIKSYNKYLQLNVGYTLEQDMTRNTFDLVFEFVVKARMDRLGKLATPRLFWLRVRCSIVLTVTTSGPNDIQAEACRNYNVVTA